MFDAIEDKLLALPGRVSLLYACPGVDAQYSFNDSEPMVAASVIKIPIMIEAFRQFEAGVLKPDQTVKIRAEQKLPSCGALTYLHDGLEVTVKDLVTLMIILSDNTATNLLIDLLGMDAINQTSENLGLTGTRLNRKLFDAEKSRQGIENYVTAKDMGRVMGLLLRGQIISYDASIRMIQILRNQRLNGKIPFYLHSRGIPVAHKTGEDDGITHDVGIIFTEDPKILCFLSNQTMVPQAERAIQEIAAMVAAL